MKLGGGSPEAFSGNLRLVRGTTLHRCSAWRRDQV